MSGDGAALSVAMIARDEADRIGPTLDSVAWADEVVVLDSGSSDRTPAVARERGGRVVRTDGFPGYGAQKQRALEEARGPWVLALDADERVSPELAREIRELLAGEPRATGYELVFHTRYLGGWLGRRGWYRERNLRLVRKDAARYTGRRVHEGLRVEGPVGRLEGPVLHHSYRHVVHHLEKTREYARLKGEEMYRNGRSTSLAGAVAHGATSFLARYLLRGRFLDGWRGLVHELVQAGGTLGAYVRLWELQRGLVAAAGPEPGGATDRGGGAGEGGSDRPPGARRRDPEPEGPPGGGPDAGPPAS